MGGSPSSSASGPADVSEPVRGGDHLDLGARQRPPLVHEPRDAFLERSALEDVVARAGSALAGSARAWPDRRGRGRSEGRTATRRPASAPSRRQRAPRRDGALAVARPHPGLRLMMPGRHDHVIAGDDAPGDRPQQLLIGGEPGFGHGLVRFAATASPWASGTAPGPRREQAHELLHVAPREAGDACAAARRSSR